MKPAEVQNPAGWTRPNSAYPSSSTGEQMGYYPAVGNILKRGGGMVVRRGISPKPWEKSRFYLRKPLGPRMEGIILRNHWAQEWTKQGSQKWLAKRVAMVKVNNVKLIAVYQSVSPNDIEIDGYRKQLETAISCRKKDEMLLIGGDHNAQIVRQDNTGKERTLGKFGLRANSEAGDEVVEWAENNNLFIVDTYFRKNNRGTWCHPRTGNWYELDYFLAVRHRNLIIKDMKVLREGRWSDHRPKMIKVSFREKKERLNRTKQEKIDWRKLRNKKYHDAYQEHISNVSLSNELSWAELAETMKRAAKPACGLEDTRSQRAVKKRNEATNEAQRHNAREELKAVRKEYKQRLREWETEWWEALLVKCEEAMRRQDIGEMYSILKQLPKSQLLLF